MKKLLLPILVLLAILHPKSTFVQDCKPFHQSELAQQAYAPVQVNAQSDSLDPDDNVIEFTDDNFDDRGKKNYSMQNIAFSTSYHFVHPIYDHFCKSKWIAQNNNVVQTPLFILIQVFRI
jgi:hypothetical protein